MPPEPMLPEEIAPSDTITLTAGDDLIRETAGYSLTIPAGWEPTRLQNNGFAILRPIDHDPQSNVPFVMLMAGPMQEVMMGNDVAPDATMDELLDAMGWTEEDILAEQRDMTIDGEPGRMLDVQSVDPIAGDIRLRIALVKLDGDRIFYMQMGMPLDGWDEASFTTFVEQLHFFAPDEPTEDMEPGMEPGMPGMEPDMEPAQPQEVVNPAVGVAATPPEGWVGFPEQEGIVMLSEAAAGSMQSDMGGIMFLLAVAEQEITQTTDLEEVTPDNMLDLLSEADTFTLADEREEITIQGFEGLAADFTMEEADETFDGRAIIVMLNKNNLFLIQGLMPEGEWEPETFERMIESIRFMEPLIAGEEGTEETTETPTAETAETPTSDAEETPTVEVEAEEIPTAEAEETPTAEAEETPTAEAEETPTAEAEETPTAEAEETP
jgi:hypothetical protein